MGIGPLAAALPTPPDRGVSAFALGAGLVLAFIVAVRLVAGRLGGCRLLRLVQAWEGEVWDFVHLLRSSQVLLG